MPSKCAVSPCDQTLSSISPRPPSPWHAGSAASSQLHALWRCGEERQLIDLPCQLLCPDATVTRRSRRLQHGRRRDGAKMCSLMRSKDFIGSFGNVEFYAQTNDRAVPNLSIYRPSPEAVGGTQKPLNVLPSTLCNVLLRYAVLASILCVALSSCCTPHASRFSSDHMGSAVQVPDGLE